MNQTASFTGLLQTILLMILFFSFFKFLMRLIAPLVLRHMAKKMSQRFNKKKPNYSQSKEGEISIDKSPKKQFSDDNIGEYVDYEELD